MSVTFSVYHNGSFVSPDGWEPEYEVDEMYGFPPDFKVQVNQNPLEMNVANGNFYRLMELLGLSTEEYCGTWGDGSLQHVREKVTFVLEGIKAIPELDGGKEDVIEKSPSGMTMIHCGVREGYFAERLTKLLEIVDKAIEVGGEVTFG